MSDFTSDELNLIGNALESARIQCSYPGAEALSYKVASMYVDSLGDHEPELCLIVGRHYTVKNKDHRWHGKRVMLHRLEDKFDGKIRTWIVNNELVVAEIPSSSLVEH